MSNLPTWPGAGTVYQRVQAINETRARLAYQAWAGSPKHKRAKHWRLPDDIPAIIDAMNEGKEETLKAYAAQWPQYWPDSGR